MSVFLRPAELPAFFEALESEQTSVHLRDYVLLSLYTGARKSNLLRHAMGRYRPRPGPVGHPCCRQQEQDDHGPALDPGILSRSSNAAGPRIMSGSAVGSMSSRRSTPLAKPPT